MNLTCPAAGTMSMGEYGVVHTSHWFGMGICKGLAAMALRLRLRSQ